MTEGADYAGAPGEPLLSVVGMSKSFAGVQALDNVDLSLMPQERLAVIGENGAGKSTLMKILGRSTSGRRRRASESGREWLTSVQWPKPSNTESR